MSLLLFRILQEEFRLVRGVLTVPVKYVRNLAYKYIVYKNDMRSKEEHRYIWEHLVHLPEFRNRCLVIPANKLKAGGKLNFCTQPSHNIVSGWKGCYTVYIYISFLLKLTSVCCCCCCCCCCWRLSQKLSSWNLYSKPHSSRGCQNKKVTKIGKKKVPEKFWKQTKKQNKNNPAKNVVIVLFWSISPHCDNFKILLQQYNQSIITAVIVTQLFNLVTHK